ncbi:MAG: hypothetical protein CMJ59_04650 [Planctomycetaceae bacterium]|nr:hypothetical protein [Planctomycetaceae bacterium]
MIGRLRPTGLSSRAGCFWVNPAGDRILSAQNDQRGGLCTIQWFGIDNDQVRHLNEVHVAKRVDTALSDTTYILRITPDGKRGFICQRTIGNGSDFCNVMIADLPSKRPAITGVIKQVGDGLESFAFHPNGNMAVATCLENTKNSLAVLDIASTPPRLLYHLDAAGMSQGIEFTPEGDRLFLGSCSNGRIEVHDVVGDFGLRKNPKLIKVGSGHNSLSIGSRFHHTRSLQQADPLQVSRCQRRARSETHTTSHISS